MSVIRDQQSAISGQLKVRDQTARIKRCCVRGPAQRDAGRRDLGARLGPTVVKDSQFLVITPAKRTMGIADVLYGITMPEAGVSKRVSLRFEEEGRHEPAVA